MPTSLENAPLFDYLPSFVIQQGHEGGAKASEFIFTPVQWDLEEFKKYAKIEEYNRHSFFD